MFVVLGWFLFICAWCCVALLFAGLVYCFVGWVVVGLHYVDCDFDCLFYYGFAVCVCWLLYFVVCVISCRLGYLLRIGVLSLDVLCLINLLLFKLIGYCFFWLLVMMLVICALIFV